MAKSLWIRNEKNGKIAIEVTKLQLNGKQEKERLIRSEWLLSMQPKFDFRFCSQFMHIFFLWNWNSVAIILQKIWNVPSTNFAFYLREYQLWLIISRSIQTQTNIFFPLKLRSWYDSLRIDKKRQTKNQPEKSIEWWREKMYQTLNGKWVFRL